MDVPKIQLRLAVGDIQLMITALETVHREVVTGAELDHARTLARYLGWRVAKFGDTGDPDRRRVRPGERAVAAAVTAGYDPR